MPNLRFFSCRSYVLVVWLHSIAEAKTSSCPDTSCACPAAPQCGCLHTHVNLTRLQQRMCPAVSKKVFQAVSIRYSKIYPLFSICALSSLITTMLTNMLKEVTFEYWRLQSGFSWKAAIISLVRDTVCTSNIFCLLLNLVHDTIFALLQTVPSGSQFMPCFQIS